MYPLVFSIYDKKDNEMATSLLGFAVECSNEDFLHLLKDKMMTSLSHGLTLDEPLPNSVSSAFDIKMINEFNDLIHTGSVNMHWLYRIYESKHNIAILCISLSSDTLMFSEVICKYCMAKTVDEYKEKYGGKEVKVSLKMVKYREGCEVESIVAFSM